MTLERVQPGPGQESVWDYPRPPALERSVDHLVIELGGLRIAVTDRALRVLETSHPPVYYLPLEDIEPTALEAAPGSSWCEFKGQAAYLTVIGGDRREVAAAWHYPSPSTGFAELRNHIAFYPSRMDRCLVDGEQVQAQQGDFYGGWITSRVVGPFKGGPGTRGW